MLIVCLLLHPPAPDRLNTGVDHLPDYAGLAPDRLPDYQVQDRFAIEDDDGEEGEEGEEAC